MTAPAVIQGSLVDARNIASHKCVRLYVDVPAELGQRIIDTFGWPTQVNPVSVAVARLNGGGADDRGRLNQQPDVSPAAPTSGDKPKQRFSELRPSAQAALRCKEQEFMGFLVATGKGNPSVAITEGDAISCVREMCGILSRSELDRDTTARNRWDQIEASYQAWRIAKGHGAA